MWDVRVRVGVRVHCVRVHCVRVHCVRGHALWLWCVTMHICVRGVVCEGACVG